MKLRSLLLATAMLASAIPCYAQMVPGSGPMVPTGPAIPIPVPVTKGGTDNTTLGAGQLLSGNGSSAIQSNIPISSVVYDGVATGTADAIIVTTTSPAFSLTSGSIVSFIATNSNDAATTVNVNGTGDIPVFRSTWAGSSALVGGEIVTGEAIFLYYDGTNFQFITPPPKPGVISSVDELTGTPDARNITIHDIALGTPLTFSNFISSFTNTGPTTFLLNGTIGPAPVVKLTPAGILPLQAGDILAGSLTLFGFNGSAFQLLNPAGDGSVSPGLANQLGFYATDGSTISGLASANRAVPNTDGSGNLSMTDSPTVNNLTANTNVQVNGSVILPSIPNGQILSAIDNSGTIGSDPGLFYVGSVFHAQYMRPQFLQVQNAFSYPSPSPTGSVQILADASAFGNVNIILPTTNGSVGQPLVSGAGTQASAWAPISGAGGTFVTSSGVPSNGCATWVSGNLGTTGVSCSPSSGSVNPGTAGQYSYYQTTGSAVSPLASVNNAVATTNGSGVAILSNTLPTLVQGNIISLGAVTSGSLNNVPIGAVTPSTGVFSSVTSPTIYGGTAANSILALQATSGVGTSDSIRFFTGGSLRGIINNGGEATFNVDVVSPLFALEGSSTGVISILGQANAGTYNFNLPTTAGSAGQALVSGGGGASPMSWGAITSGSIDGVPIGATTPSTGVFTSLVDNGLTAGRVLYTDGSNTITTNGNLLYDGATLTGLASSFASLTLRQGGNGISVVPPTLSSSYALTLPTSAGTNGQFFTSAGAGSPWTYTSTIPVGSGGTSATSFTTHGVLLGNGSGAIQATAVGATGSVFIGNTGADPSFSTSPTIGTSVTTPLVIVEGASTGNITIQGQNNAGTYNYNLPTTAGSAGQFLTSQAGGSTAMTWTSPPAFTGVDGGTANAHTIAATGYVLTTGVIVTTVWTSTNTGATTVNVNGTGVKNLLKPVVVTGPVALAANDLTTGNAAEIMYDGTQFQLISR